MTTTINGDTGIDIVTSNTTASLELKENNDAGTTVLYNTINGSTGNNYIYFGDAADANAGQIRYNHNADHMSFNTNATERVRIDSNGNVGIGTATPQSPLEIQSEDDISMNASGTGHLEIDGNGYNFAIALDADAANIYTNTAARDLVFGTNEIERMRIDGTGNLKFDSGYGSVATAFGVRAWVNFDGTGTVAIRDSGNVTSITDNGTGNYTINFTTAMPDANYAAVANTHTSYTTGGEARIAAPQDYQTGSVVVETGYGTFANQDEPIVNVAVFR